MGWQGGACRKCRHLFKSANAAQRTRQCLKHTLGLENDQWRILDQAHRKRNIAEYEGGLDIDAALVEALIRVANTVAERIQR